MADYPETIRVGIPPVQATYVDDERINRIQTEAKLRPRGDDHARRADRALRGVRLRRTRSNLQPSR
jgi:hypothetical protein